MKTIIQWIVFIVLGYVAILAVAALFQVIRLEACAHTGGRSLNACLAQMKSEWPFSSITEEQS